MISLALAALAGAIGACDFGAVAFRADFEGARLSGCRQAGESAYELEIAPENAPINPSAWYAFAIDAAAPASLSLTLIYEDGRHRYAPKRQLEDGSWRLLQSPIVSQDETRATFRVEAPAGRTLIAAQPPIGSATYSDWLERAARVDGFKRRRIGVSREGRAIDAIETRARRPATAVLVGRQHPPETTGALAYFAFSERLFADDPLAMRFRARFGILAIPNLNPDGVTHGNWRNNSGGVDLNRDWGPFTQPETRAARKAIARATRRNHDLALFLDFHATNRNVLYTQPDDAAGRRAWFAGAWSAAIAGQVANPPPRDASHNPALPTAKTWVHVTYETPAITFEIGDDTPPDEIRELAIRAAEAAMRLLLDGPPG